MNLKKVFQNKDSYVAVMDSEDFKVSEFTQYQKSDKAPSIIYADLESLIKKYMEVKTILKNHP